MAASKVRTFYRCGQCGQQSSGFLGRCPGCGEFGSMVEEVETRSVVVDNFARRVGIRAGAVGVMGAGAATLAGLPKAEAARRRLRAINSAVTVESVVSDVNAGNIESLCGGANLILDGTDNFETRFLINDVAVKLRIPWIYGACVAGAGLVMPILPRETPCLRCIWEDVPPAGMSPTCDTVGVLSPVVNIVASFQAVHALKILTGNAADLNRDLLTIDGWNCRVHGMNMQPAYDAGACPCCGQGRYDFLEGELGSRTTTLCGRNAVQILPSDTATGMAAEPDRLERIADRLGDETKSRLNRYMLRFQVDDYEVSVFADGRAIIKGTNDPAVARSVYSRYVGQ